MQVDLHRPAERGCVGIRFGEIVVRRWWRTMELGRSAPMRMPASPGGAAAMVPAPIERIELPGHRQ